MQYWRRIVIISEAAIEASVEQQTNNVHEQMGLCYDLCFRYARLNDSKE